MKLVPVALALFHRFEASELNVWTQVRTDSGPYEGLLEFPGGGIEAGEDPLSAAVREVEEEVGIRIDPALAKFMGTYVNELTERKIILYVFLFPVVPQLAGIGHWLPVTSALKSSVYAGKIPAPNHRIIDDLFNSLYDGSP